jgi:flagellar motor component MotA
MALAVVNTTGTWGKMLFTHQETQAALIQGQAGQDVSMKKKKISLIVGALLLFEGIVAIGDVLSDGKFAGSLSPDPWFIIIFTAGLSFATLILTPVGWMLKTYAEVKLEEAELMAQALLQQQGGTPNAAAQGA